jgi:diguanylate cyclase (GGDEF)-like protein
VVPLGVAALLGLLVGAGLVLRLQAAVLRQVEVLSQEARVLALAERLQADSQRASRHVRGLLLTGRDEERRQLAEARGRVAAGVQQLEAEAPEGPPRQLLPEVRRQLERVREAADGVVAAGTTPGPGGAGLVGADAERRARATGLLERELEPARSRLDVLLFELVWRAERQLSEARAAEGGRVRGLFGSAALALAGALLLCAALGALLLRTLRTLERQVAQRTEALRAANLLLAEQATRDPLTGAWNRRALDARLGEECVRARRTGGPLTLVLVDVDRFKAVNDELGHAEGDAVLVALVGVVARTLRATDLLARYGGEEFALLLPDTPPEGGRVLAERVRAAVEAHPWPKRPVTASFGVASLGGGRDAAAARTLLADADRALYAAKRAGRNRVSLAPPPGEGERECEGEGECEPPTPERTPGPRPPVRRPPR